MPRGGPDATGLDRAESLLALWFPEDPDDLEAVGDACTRWFSQSDAFDAALERDFGDLPELARQGALDSWAGAPRPALARVICLDQLPRNLYRGDARAFAHDAAGLAAARDAIGRGHDRSLHPLMALFFHMPFEHAESLDDQARCIVALEALTESAPEPLRPRFESFIEYARRHHAVIEAFGRFPHRTDVLGRTHTPEERRYLSEGGETFGAGSDAED